MAWGWRGTLLAVMVGAAVAGCLGTFEPLHTAVHNQDAYTVKVLLQQGADVNEQNLSGWTPLMRAAYAGNVTITKLLLEHGADPHIKNKFGETARTIAESLDHTLVANVLKDAEGGPVKP